MRAVIRAGDSVPERTRPSKDEPLETCRRSERPEGPETSTSWRSSACEDTPPRIEVTSRRRKALRGLDVRRVQTCCRPPRSNPAGCTLTGDRLRRRCRWPAGWGSRQSSSSPMKPVPSDTVRKTWTGFVKSTKKVSPASSSWSPRTLTVTVRNVSPAGKVTVPAAAEVVAARRRRAVTGGPGHAVGPSESTDCPASARRSRRRCRCCLRSR